VLYDYLRKSAPFVSEVQLDLDAPVFPVNPGTFHPRGGAQVVCPDCGAPHPAPLSSLMLESLDYTASFNLIESFGA
jgi:hypothetical protein